MNWSFNPLPTPEELQQHHLWAPELSTSIHGEQMTQPPGQPSMEPAPCYPLTPPQSLPSQCASLPSPRGLKMEAEEQPQDWHLPLHIAVEQGHELIIRELLRAAVGINESDSAGRTAVHIAVHQKQEGVLRILLEHGPDVNAIDKMGWTPVHHAVQNGFTSGLKLLMEHGSNLALRAPKRSP
ncbi:hypothetical protein N7517_007589 [Penicillium concentricum]|uniref:Uncharacterized protein n=1 Tax=Penicillium concentricum TaxID=293559 RepID=A0A9W9SG80_9EURO|nr:uncharacterized protein N7517_007589 [Penicillium concentricum]KAJ5375583.1 hypothetical protein N7517_007589 [Penicillium concentricum]